MANANSLQCFQCQEIRFLAVFRHWLFRGNFLFTIQKETAYRVAQDANDAWEVYSERFSRYSISKQFPKVRLKTQLRVVGGSPSLPGQLPWQIEILNKYDPDWVCGGTLISPTKIVWYQKFPKKKLKGRFLIP